MFAEVGVVLLMFSIGVEFSIPDLMRVKWVALVGAPMGILFMMGVSVAAGMLAGWGTTEGLVIGATARRQHNGAGAARTDAGKLSTTYGSVMIGITLVEDLAVICMTVILPVFGGSGEGRTGQAAWVLAKALILLIPLIFFAIKVIPRVLRRVKLICNPELFLLVAIAVCLEPRRWHRRLDFRKRLELSSPAYPSVASKDLHDTHTKLVPLRDAFVALFLFRFGTLVIQRRSPTICRFWA